MARVNQVKMTCKDTYFCLVTNIKCLKLLFLHGDWLMFEIGDRLFKASDRAVLPFFGDV